LWKKVSERHFPLVCNAGSAGVHDQFAAVPAEAEFFNHDVRFFQAEPDDGGITVCSMNCLSGRFKPLTAVCRSAGSRPAASGATARALLVSPEENFRP